VSEPVQTKPMPASIVESGELWGRYPARCQCGCAMLVRPSLSMQHGINSGHGSCLDCKAFLHLTLNEAGTEIETEPWADYEARGFKPKPCNTK